MRTISSFNLSTNNTNLRPSLNIDKDIYCSDFDSDNRILYLGGSFENVEVGSFGNRSLALFNEAGSLVHEGLQCVGLIETIAADGNGGFYIGGDFTYINNVARPGNLAHINSSGKLTSWAPIANSIVRAICVIGNNVYIGGDFHG